MRLAKQAQQVVLGGVGILVLVDHEIAEALLPGAADLRLVPQQAHGEEQDVVEVDGVEGLEGLLVAGVDPGREKPFGVAVADGELGGGDQAVLGIGDEPENPLEVATLSLRQQVANQVANQPHLIGTAVDGEVLFEAETFDVFPQNAQRQGVEGGDDQAFPGLAADHRRHPLAHFAGGLVGKGYGQDLLRRHPLLQQEDDAAGDHPGFAGPGAGEQQQRPLGVAHGGLLRGVEIGQVHRESSRETVNRGREGERLPGEGK